MNLLKNQVVLVQHTSNWLLDTGDLRQIGKTSTLVDIANEYTEAGKNVLLVVSNASQKKRLQKENSNINVITYNELENTLRGNNNKFVVLLDDARFTTTNYMRILRENEHRIEFKFGWY